MSLKFPDFHLNHATFEVRYGTAYEIWDSSGKIWKAIADKIGPLANEGAQPSTQRFRFGGGHIIQIELMKAYVALQDAENQLDQLYLASDVMVRTIVESLGIASFERIGLRLMYLQSLGTKEAVSSALLANNMVALPKQEIMGIKEPTVWPECGFKMEGESTGCRVRVEHRGERLEVNIPLGWERPDTLVQEREGVLLDVDYFTTKEATVGQLNAKKWIEQAIHLVRRDIPKVLSGFGQ